MSEAGVQIGIQQHRLMLMMITIIIIIIADDDDEDFTSSLEKMRKIWICIFNMSFVCACDSLAT